MWQRRGLTHWTLLHPRDDDLVRPLGSESDRQKYLWFGQVC